MGVQALPLGKIGNTGLHLPQRLPGVINKAALFHKVVHAQRAAEACRAAGGQRMVGACEIIAQRLRHIFAQKDAACIFDLGKQAERLVHTHLQMLGGYDVHGLHRLAQIAAHNDLAVGIHAFPCNFLARQLRDLHLQLGLHGLCQRLAVRYQHGACQHIVLGLTQKIGRHPRRVTGAVGQHQNFAGACDHINAHLAEHLALGRGHKNIARAHDLIHSGHALGAVGQGRNGLCAA